ncbi:MAG: hypothetical protein K9N10_22890 [Deltaproteobacteria bacterium]|nr:hypothetical protein [Deltaproteobacteria bacterium]
MKKLVILAVAFPLLFTSCKMVPRSAYRDKVLYTRVNMWYDYDTYYGCKIKSTNYHNGQRLPVGTKVTVTEAFYDRINFKAIDTGQTFNLYNVRKYTVVPIRELFSRMFSETNDLDNVHFTEQEMNAIRRGKIEIGMSKDAVLMSYGYPPAHRTANLSYMTWVYWHNRFNTISVEFLDDKVVEIKN